MEQHTCQQPVRYVGNETANIDYHDGQLRPAIGVQNYQVLRANREHPEFSGGFGWTYNHAPMLTYWKGKFYLEYLSNPVGEHEPPGQTLLTGSEDGIHWENPRVVFPPYKIPDGVYCGKMKEELPKGSSSVMHQRMGFHISPGGRLLALGFYGICPTPSVSPNSGYGIGRVVREIYAGGDFGPIYFIRYNRHAGWNEGNTHYPYYTVSPDREFRDACEALLSDKLATLQWWEEDRSKDGFYAIEGGLALSYYHLPDGRAVGLWKFSRAAVSSDEGKSWSEMAEASSLVMSGGKVWGQRTSDGRYALLYNPSTDSKHRWPLALVTGDNGEEFDGLLAVQGDVSQRRYAGSHKDLGPNYVRGIEEGQESPPDGAMWVTYSMNKEDIWVSRIPVPIRCKTDLHVHDTFNGMQAGGEVTDWNIYSPEWARVSVEEFPSADDKSLVLRDKDPYDYAKAQRVFPESIRASIGFKVMAKQSFHGQLYAEAVDHKGAPGIRLIFDSDGSIKANKGGAITVLREYCADTWYEISIAFNTATHRYSAFINGEETKAEAWYFLAPVLSLERLIFRTGPARRTPNTDAEVEEKLDLPAAGEPGREAVFYINEVRTGAAKELSPGRKDLQEGLKR